MGNRKWEMGNGKFEIGSRKWEEIIAVYSTFQLPGSYLLHMFYFVRNVIKSGVAVDLVIGWFK